MIGLQALAAALASGALDHPPVLFRLPGLSPIVQDLYRAAADLCEVRDLPWAEATPERPFAAAAGFARVIDIRDFAFDPSFRGVAMIDWFLRALGLDPDRVPAALRRNAWLAGRMTPAPPAGLGAGYILVCPNTSMPLRDMPEAVHATILRTLAEAGHRVVTQGAPAFGAVSAPRAGDLAGLCGLVAGARAMVSADTAMPHLADAFSVPCLAFFTTHRPEWRVRDYPLNRAVQVPVPELPPALEFARDDADVAAAAAAWFRRDADLGWLWSELITYFATR